MGIDIHKARIFDIAIGIGADVSMAQTAITARSNALIKSSIKAFRDKFIDQATPSIYVIDLELDVLIPIITSNPNIVDKDRLSRDILNNFNKKTTKVSSITLISRIKDAETVANTALKNIYTIGKTGAQLHNAYRNIMQTLGKDVGSLFTTKSILRLEDPISIGQPDKLVFIGKSFSIMKSGINDAINTAIRQNSGTVLYGNIRAAGHTSVELAPGSFRINTPLLSETLLRLEAGGLSDKPSQLSLEKKFISKVPLFTKYKITFSENFSPTADTLLDIGFTFVRPMGVTENSSSGSREEKQARDSIIENKVFPELIETLKKRVSWLKDHILEVKNSPNIPQYIGELVAASLSKTNTPIYKDNTQKSGKLSLGSIILASIPKINKTLAKVKYTNPIRTTQGQFYSLASLQILLNTHLQDVVSANMGDEGYPGGQRRILNYRTGRFAASAQVERMSQSREGMITAFYSYMKNPYQVFEPGHRMGNPLTRDPKLLISKSIREIAATKVGNTLRAVRV